MSRGWRNVMFTQFLETSECDGGVLLPEEWPDVAYCVWQVETCPETGKLHYQGYVEFVGQKRIEWMHSNLPGLETAHFEQRMGSQSQAKEYCRKEDTRSDGPWEWGECREQGKRSDLEDVKRRLEKRDPEGDIASDHFGSWIRYHKSFTEFKRLKNLEEKRDWTMHAELYIGPSGCGKTQAVKAKYPDAYWKPHGKWWDGYFGQEVTIVDEMYGHRFAFTELLNLLDSGPMQIEFKGGFRQFTSKKIVFTTNQEPELWYNGEKTHQMVWEQNPLKRRLDEFCVRFSWDFPPNPNPLGYARQMILVDGQIQGN